MVIKVLCYLYVPIFNRYISHSRNKWFKFVDHRFFKVASLPTCFLFAANLFNGHFLRQEIWKIGPGVGTRQKWVQHTSGKTLKNNLLGFEVWNMNLDRWLSIDPFPHLAAWVCFAKTSFSTSFSHVNSNVCLWSRDPAAWNLEDDALYLLKLYKIFIPSFPTNRESVVEHPLPSIYDQCVE